LLLFTPQLQLETLFVLDDERRILATREYNRSPGPAFCLIRNGSSCVWAVNADVPQHVAAKVGALAASEPLTNTLTDPPRHADAYVALLRGRVDAGPVFTFPANLPASNDSVVVTDLSVLERHLHGWTADELPHCAPIFGILEDGYALSVCFCARRSPEAAEAGLNTADSFRNRGLGSRVTSAWARAIRDSGRLPLYSTSWENPASLGVARKLQLTACGCDWSLYR
jgi:hypothetical protein